MTNEIQLAFAHPEVRADSTTRLDPRDRISLRDHIVPVEIGAFQAERGTTQRLCFNIVVEVRPHPAPLHDDVDRILSYDRITEAIAAEFSSERLNLLETLAERIADRIFLEPQAMRVFVRIEKLDRGPGALGVEIVRSRAASPVQALASDGSQSAVHPLVVLMANDQILASGLSQQLDALQALGLPVVLCVGLPDSARPQVALRPVQRRIDLLAMEQNAWQLAARDPRCVVVQSRTEMDWAIRRGQMIVWAPSKLVLDATDGPGPDMGDGVVLSVWLAEMLAADRILLPADAQIPPGTRIPSVIWGGDGSPSPAEKPE
ncbi:dihydroneopterin aldolase [Roseicitreum antarcticum]|uniref:dihydroneopterin aldolase n=1 Tax=Roseicitreum antarcticum TaxID=564137 RepID=A0A1H2VM54_9RHOB|nr:dihydroneopterin aldolase [Roseicitreum antarcticum]SDW69357.1 dihydroneopterin aldolase [Roseicitreum antarcticum]